MKNKNLAIILSILAVIVVGYRIFSPGDQKPVNRAKTQKGVLNAPTGGLPGNPLLNEQQTSLIRIDPQMLLENVDYQTQRYQFRELTMGGKNIFIENSLFESGDLGVDVEEDSVEYKYSLFAIVIDQDRKIALINKHICQQGDVLAGGAIVQEIKKGSVELKIEGEKVILYTNPKIDEIKSVQGE